MIVHSLTLKDFQVHKKFKLDFSPGITTIVGPTDAGKSSILRALRWICLNDLLGDDFVREGADEAEVTLVAGSGKAKATFVRRKGQRGENVYVLNTNEFRAFGQSVPAPIANLLAVNEINFQSQHDSPFWFSDGAAEVSRQLNAIVDLSIIDTALSNIANTVRKTKERKELCYERLGKAKVDYDAIEWQIFRIHDFQSLQARNTALKDLQVEGTGLQDLINRIEKNDAEALRDKAKDMEALLGKARAYFSAAKEEDALAEILASIKAQEGAAKTPPSFAAVQQAYREWSETEDKERDLRMLIKSAESTELEYRRLSDAATVAMTKFNLKVKDERCPLCDQLIK